MRKCPSQPCEAVWLELQAGFVSRRCSDYRIEPWVAFLTSSTTTRRGEQTWQENKRRIIRCRTETPGPDRSRAQQFEMVLGHTYSCEGFQTFLEVLADIQESAPQSMVSRAETSISPCAASRAMTSADLVTRTLSGLFCVNWIASSMSAWSTAARPPTLSWSISTKI